MIIYQQQRSGGGLARAVGYLGLALASSVVGWAQVIPGLPAGETPAVESTSELPTRAELEARRSELAGRRDALRQAVDDPGAAAELSYLGRVDRLLGQQLETLRRYDELMAEVGDEPPAEPARRFDHEPPYRVAELDATLDELAQEGEDLALLGDTVEAARSAVETAKRRLEELARAQRLAEDAMTDAVGDGALEQSEVVERRRETELNQEELRQRQLELRNAIEQSANHQLRCQRAQQLVDWVRPRTAATPAELTEILAELDKRAEVLRSGLESAEGSVRDQESAWRVAEQRLMSRGDDSALAALEVARRVGRDLVHRRRVLLTEQADRLDRLREVWGLRFKILTGAIDPGELRSTADAIELGVADIEREERLARRQLEEAERDLTRAHDRRVELIGEPQTRHWLEAQESSAEALVELLRQQLTSLEDSLRVHRRLLDEIRSRVDGLTFEERLAVLGGWIERLWGYEVVAADGQPITTGKVLVALFVLLLGFWLAKRLTGRLGELIASRMNVDKGIAAAYQTLAFYCALVLVFLLALRLVNIPLTVFTVLGGVVAIGVGFGSQNIVNNFISGLILLAERPIKVGDLVDVGGVQGTVERIGLRSARIRAGDNTHIIVPNSSFLENNVLNWTMSDNVLRMQLDVGVAYGSPVEEVRQLLEQAMEDEPSVLPTPPSEVLFVDFGADSLVFRAFFWLRVRRPLDRLRAASALRFRIDRLFADHGLVIAFPQRDVHLDASEPLAVRLVRDDDSPG